jgi:hypothetical protein
MADTEGGYKFQDFHCIQVWGNIVLFSDRLSLVIWSSQQCQMPPPSRNHFHLPYSYSESACRIFFPQHALVSASDSGFGEEIIKHLLIS